MTDSVEYRIYGSYNQAYLEFVSNWLYWLTTEKYPQTILFRDERIRWNIWYALTCLLRSFSEYETYLDRTIVRILKEYPIGEKFCLRGLFKCYQNTQSERVKQCSEYYTPITDSWTNCTACNETIYQVINFVPENSEIIQHFANDFGGYVTILEE